MKTCEYTLKATDGIDIQIYEWLPDDPEKVKKILHVVHGMAEHCGRYVDLANFLTSNNIAVYGHDHRGHGKTAGTVENLGFIAPKNGWKLLVSDLQMINNHIKTKYNNIPMYILGHSMGSFVVRNFIQETETKIQGAIISGTAGDPGFAGKMGVFITALMKLFYPANSPSPFMDKLSFGAYNKPFKPNRTKFDWLSRDNEQVDKYVKDSFCGTIFSVSFFSDLLTGLLHISGQKNINKVAEDLALLLFSGDKDPVGNLGKGPVEVYNKHKKAGVKNITLKLFPEGRHEMINEMNRQEVFQFILDWLSKN